MIRELYMKAKLLVCPLLVQNFEVDAERKRSLINGLDYIGLTLQYEDQIRSFEAEHFKKYPWL